MKADALFKLGVRAVSSDKAAVKLGGITVIRLHGHQHFQTVGFYFYKKERKTHRSLACGM